MTQIINDLEALVSLCMDTALDAEARRVQGAIDDGTIAVSAFHGNPYCVIREALESHYKTHPDFRIGPNGAEVCEPIDNALGALDWRTRKMCEMEDTIKRMKTDAGYPTHEDMRERDRKIIDLEDALIKIASRRLPRGSSASKTTVMTSTQIPSSRHDMPDPTISYPWADEAQTMVDFQKVKVNGELATDLLEQRDRYRAALERLSKEAPIGDYVADLYSDLCNPLLIEELDQRADFAREALRNPESVNARA